MVPGNVVRARYRLVRLLGEGGMGAVFEAEDLELRRTCALKVLQARLVGDPTVYRRFLREAEFAAGLEHEHVVRVFDRGELADGVPFYTMELLRGRSLADVAQEGRLEWRRTRHIVLQLCRVLALVHARRIVHRDLKPDNCFLVTLGGDADFLKLLDFGLAREDADGGDPRLTTTSEVLGTALYMSPQQALGEQVDHRCDVYAVGVILYQLLTGYPPFARANALQVLEAIKNETPPPPSYHNPRLPLEVDALVEKAMHKDLARRYQSAEELLAGLAAISPDAVVIGAPAMPVRTPQRVHTPTALALTLAADAALAQSREDGGNSEVAMGATVPGSMVATNVARVAGAANATPDARMSAATPGTTLGVAGSLGATPDARMSGSPLELPSTSGPTLSEKQGGMRRWWPLAGVGGVLGIVVVVAMLPGVLEREPREVPAKSEPPVEQVVVAPLVKEKDVEPLVDEKPVEPSVDEKPVEPRLDAKEDALVESVQTTIDEGKKKKAKMTKAEAESKVNSWASRMQNNPPGDCAKIPYSKTLEFVVEAEGGQLVLSRASVKPETRSCAEAMEGAFRRSFPGKSMPVGVRKAVTFKFGK